MTDTNNEDKKQHQQPLPDYPYGTSEEDVEKEVRDEVNDDLDEVEGTESHTIPRPSEDGDADEDLDERGGNQHQHDVE